MSFLCVQFSLKMNENNSKVVKLIFFVRFLGGLKIPKRHFEINWPLSLMCMTPWYCQYILCIGVGFNCVSLTQMFYPIRNTVDFVSKQFWSIFGLEHEFVKEFVNLFCLTIVRFLCMYNHNWLILRLARIYIPPKGQLISKCPFGVTESTKKATKFL